MEDFILQPEEEKLAEEFLKVHELLCLPWFQSPGNDIKHTHRPALNQLAAALGLPPNFLTMRNRVYVFISRLLRLGRLLVHKSRRRRVPVSEIMHRVSPAVRRVLEELDIVEIVRAMGRPCDREPPPTLSRPKLEDFAARLATSAVKSLENRLSQPEEDEDGKRGDCDEVRRIRSVAAVIPFAQVSVGDRTALLRMWRNMCRGVMRKLSADEIRLAPFERRVADLLLLYEPHVSLAFRGSQLVRSEHSLRRLLRLVTDTLDQLPLPFFADDVVFASSKGRLTGASSDITAYAEWVRSVWTAVYLAHRELEPAASSVVLQRRWHEMRIATYVGVDSVLVLGELAKRLPLASHAPPPPWLQLVRRGLVFDLNSLDHEKADAPDHLDNIALEVHNPVSEETTMNRLLAIDPTKAEVKIMLDCDPKPVEGEASDECKTGVKESLGRKLEMEARVSLIPFEHSAAWTRAAKRKYGSVLTSRDASWSVRNHALLSLCRPCSVHVQRPAILPPKTSPQTLSAPSPPTPSATSPLTPSAPSPMSSLPTPTPYPLSPIPSSGETDNYEYIRDDLLKIMAKYAQKKYPSDPIRKRKKKDDPANPPLDEYEEWERQKSATLPYFKLPNLLPARPPVTVSIVAEPPPAPQPLAEQTCIVLSDSEEAEPTEPKRLRTDWERRLKAEVELLRREREQSRSKDIGRFGPTKTVQSIIDEMSTQTETIAPTPLCRVAAVTSMAGEKTPPWLKANTAADSRNDNIGHLPQFSFALLEELQIQRDGEAPQFFRLPSDRHIRVGEFLQTAEHGSAALVRCDLTRPLMIVSRQFCVLTGERLSMRTPTYWSLQYSAGRSRLVRIQLDDDKDDSPLVPQEGPLRVKSFAREKPDQEGGPLIYKMLSDDPPVVAVVYGLVQDMDTFHRLKASGIKLYLYSLTSGTMGHLVFGATNKAPPVTLPTISSVYSLANLPTPAPASPQKSDLRLRVPVIVDTERGCLVVVGSKNDGHQATSE
ncbi:unnamed protein product [Leptosia nina]|uniref:Uncharacterized protein n=1 Tax=Leptosia nina TaxID=320188 RepID=A0AAV1JNS1_9NEOP